MASGVPGASVLVTAVTSAAPRPLGSMKVTWISLGPGALGSMNSCTVYPPARCSWLTGRRAWSASDRPGTRATRAEAKATTAASTTTSTVEERRNDRLAAAALRGEGRPGGGAEGHGGGRAPAPHRAGQQVDGHRWHPAPGVALGGGVADVGRRQCQAGGGGGEDRQPRLGAGPEEAVPPGQPGDRQAGQEREAEPGQPGATQPGAEHATPH